MKKEDESDFEWDRKRVIFTALFLVAALLIAFELKGMFLDTQGKRNVLGETSIRKSEEIKKPQIEGPSINLQSEVGSRIDEIKKNINGLDAVEIASSSPQIQKVLRDIQGIKDLPANQAKDACFKICSGI